MPDPEDIEKQNLYKKIKELESKINKLIIRIDTLEELINKDGECV